MLAIVIPPRADANNNDRNKQDDQEQPSLLLQIKSINWLGHNNTAFSRLNLFSGECFQDNPFVNPLLAADSACGSNPHSSSILQTWSLSPASIAGVTRNVE